MSDKIEYIELRLVDIKGNLRGMTVPLEEPVQTIEDVKNDPILQKGINVDGSSLPGFAKIENSDLHLTPDTSTLFEIPYLKRRKAAVLCFLYNRSETSDKDSPFLGDSRNLLKQILQNLFPSNTVKIKPEPEFYIIDDSNEFDVLPIDRGGYIDISPADMSSDLMIDFSNQLRDMGIPVHYLHHENGPSQHEIEIQFNKALKICDDLVTFKPTIKAIALQNQARVTFMPKPFSNEAGSGLHFHLQIWNGQRNIFGDPDNPEKISDIARWFIGGLLRHAPAITAIANPSINSYKRLGAYEAPIYITWGYRNRSTLVRVPLFRDADKVAIEIRSPDFTANPYLLLSVLLQAGKDGIDNKIEPPQPRTENVYLLNQEKLVSEGINVLPSNLGRAITALETDPIILNSLGSHIGPAWLEIKRKEWMRYNNEIITDFEIQTYLDC
ncbi:MAG: glutamine synthetase family protein [Candidatus Kariarchaeaceae archaeon]|jgi:glutamine synthetase